MATPEASTPEPFAVRSLAWFAADRVELAQALSIPAETREHPVAASALERWVVSYRRADGVVGAMRREGRYKFLPEADVRAEAPAWLEAQWEVLLVELAGDKQVYRAHWQPDAWDRVAADLARALGLPFLRDAARRGIFGFRPKGSRLGFLSLREVRETIKSWSQIDPTRFRGTALRLDLIEEIQDSLRAVSHFEREMMMTLV